MDGRPDPLGMQKDAAEMRLHDALLQFWRGQLERIKKRILPGVPRARRASPADRLNKAFWDGEDRELMAVLMPILTDMATDGGQSFAEWAEDKYGIGVSWGLINSNAADWARAYSYTLVKGSKRPRKINGLNTTTAKQLQSRIANWIETPGANLGELYTTLEKLPAFNAHRARLVAVTETSRAFAAGTIEGARAFEDEGFFQWRKIWNTVNNQNVCPICRPLHDTSVVGVDAEFETIVGPLSAVPAHPGCLCWITLEPVEEVAVEDATPVVFDTPGDAGKWLSSTQSLNPKLTASESEAMREYKGEAFYQVNDDLREGGYSQYVTESGEDIVDLLDAALAKSRLDVPVVVYRGVSYEVFEDDDDLTGEKYKDGAFVSTSLVRQTAEGFSDGLIIEIHVPAGAQAINRETWAVGEDESELLLPRDSEFKIISDTGADDEDRQMVWELVL